MHLNQFRSAGKFLLITGYSFLTILIIAISELSFLVEKSLLELANEHNLNVLKFFNLAYILCFITITISLIMAGNQLVKSVEMEVDTEEMYNESNMFISTSNATHNVIIPFENIEFSNVYLFSEKNTWSNALIACNNLGKNWRLPTILELNSLFETKDQIDGLLNSAGFFWSATEFDESSAWSQNSFTGKKNNDVKNSLNYYLAVLPK